MSSKSKQWLHDRGDWIYTTLGFWSAIAQPPTNGAVIPYITLYTAPQGGTFFTPLASTRVEGAPFTSAMPQQSMTYGSLENINLFLPKGTRIMIVGSFAITADKAKSYYTYFCGGVGLRIME